MIQKRLVDNQPARFARDAKVSSICVSPKGTVIVSRVPSSGRFDVLAYTSAWSPEGNRSERLLLTDQWGRDSGERGDVGRGRRGGRDRGRAQRLLHVRGGAGERCTGLLELFPEQPVLRVVVGRPRDRGQHAADR